ncbi:hypothetical protein ACQKWADRAFT_291663 [Trichoderma austrokoningii]
MDDTGIIGEYLAKVQLEEAAHLWSQVPARKGRKGRRRPQPVDAPVIKSKTTLPLSKEAIAKDHCSILQAHKDSDENRVLISMINEMVADKIKKFGSGDIFRKAICLGIGTFNPESGSWAAKERAHVQYLTFCIIVEEIQKHCKEPIRVLVQEPVFEASDVEFVTSMGHEVVQSPAAFEAVDSTTFVFGIHLYRDIYAEVFKNGEIPGLFIGTGWDVWSDVCYRWSREEYSSLKILRDMEDTHRKFVFPEISGKNYFHGTSLYWD